jgi:outer membrane receptor protein involved in Fe transport
VDAVGRIRSGAENRFLGEVTQHEVGVKNRGNAGGIKYGVFATLFQTNTKEYSYDQTRIQRGLDPIQVDKFKAKGLELESAVSVGTFALNANMTITDMKNSAGYTPHANSKLMYTLTPRYTLGPVTLGATLVGKSKSPNGDTPTDGYTEGHMIVNAFASVDVAENAVLSINAGNVFNKIASSGQVSSTSTPGLYNFRPEAGRTVSATLRYNF